MTATTVRGRLTAVGAQWRSAAELGLAYAIWGVGISLFFGPLSDLLSDAGTATVGVFVLVYPVVIQVPLAIHYDRAFGVTATPQTRWEFVDTRLFHPVVVYGLFGGLWLGLISLALDLWRPEFSGSGLEPVFTLIVILILGLLVFLAYFPVVMTAALVLRGAHRAVRRLTGSTVPPPHDTDGPADADEPPTDTPPPDEDSGRDTDAPATGGAADTSNIPGGRAENDRNVRFVSLLGLVMLPVGAGWVAGEPTFGMSVASLILTVYQIAYNR